MLNLFNEKGYSAVVQQLRTLGYRNELLEEGYRFPDWFKKGAEREAPAVAFGQTPPSYESAVIGVVCPNGTRELALVDEYRSLCAPTILEVDNNGVREWLVSRNSGAHALVTTVGFDALPRFFADRATHWRPQELLRSKNIGVFPWTHQPDLFAGLVPALEECVQAELEPLLQRALAETRAVFRETSRNGRDANETHLFKLIFAILTAKVFYDRRIKGFASLAADPDAILAEYFKRYRENPVTLLNHHARKVAVSHIWGTLDFRNLSVEVLAQMWSTMLIDAKTKERLGIHRTSRTLVRYVVDKIEFLQAGDDNRIILEPCTGSSAFLIGAMNKLRPTLFGMTPKERHDYFIKRLVGIEQDAFGVEISKLALTLADFPNTGAKWKISEDDVFKDGVLTAHLKQAGAVLCNPPFADFDREERTKYELQSFHKPVELLQRVLRDLHPSGVIGFVLPRNIADGNGYKHIRAELAKRFASIDLTVLPDRAFPDADMEPALLVATDPIPHNSSRLFFRKVRDSQDDWKRFELLHRVTTEHTGYVTPKQATESLAIPDLADLWKHLENFKILDDVANVHRGVEWERKLTENGIETGNRRLLVRDTPEEGFRLGVAPQTKFSPFQDPILHYLNFNKDEERGHSFNRPWEQPKVILNKSAKSRGPWRIAAFPDSQGVPFYQTFIGVWVKKPTWDEVLLSLVLNSPLANAFVATREGKTDVTLETLRDIPVPNFTTEQAHRARKLVNEYRAAINTGLFAASSNADPEVLLKKIDALVLDAYRLPARLEHELLSYFEGHNSKRSALHAFGEYLPKDYESYFSLSTHLSARFRNSTVGNLRKRLGLGN
jgi:SAM-dependent methyltransferase